VDLTTREGRRAQGARIQAAAESAGLALAELAQGIGCSRALIYQYVSGQVLAQADRVQAIAQLCGRPLEWFYAAEAPLETPGAAPAEAPRDVARERAVELVEQLRALAEAQAAPPDFARARSTCTRLVEASRAVGDAHALAEAEFRLGQACYALGDLEGTRGAMSRAVEAFGQLGDGKRERAARQTLGAALAGLGERDKALAEFEAVIAGGDFGGEWRGRLGRADVYEALGRGEAALAELDAAEALIAAQPDGAGRQWAELYLRLATINVYLLHDDYPRAEDAARRCAPLAEALACVAQHVEARLNLGFARRRRLAWAGALEAYDDALRVARLTGDQERAAVAQALRAELSAALGNLDEARAAAKAALKETVNLGSLRGEIYAHLALSEACRRGGEGNEALHHGQQALSAASAHELTKLEATARLAVAAARRALGEAPSAAIEARRAAAIGERIGARGIQAGAALELADLAFGGGDLGGAQTRLEEGRALAREIGDGELELRASVLSARLAGARGDAEAAGESAETALRGWLALRDSLAEADVEAAWLEDVERLTAWRACLTLLCESSRGARAAELLEAAAWPPLEAEFRDRLS